MKALEDKITAILFTGVKDLSIISHTENTFSDNIADVAKEVKDIAIGFGEEIQRLNETNYTVTDFTACLDDFLKQRYGK